MSVLKTCAAATLVFAVAAAEPVDAQYSLGLGVDYLGYSFDKGLGADAAQLFMAPVAVRIPLSRSLTVDIFSAWAEGRVEQNNQVLKLSGPVDTSTLPAGSITSMTRLSRTGMVSIAPSIWRICAAASVRNALKNKAGSNA